ncbi:hypothetical protein FACS1894219_07610 [Clostridia bacterium]|nr:hypothetical protein FACS1894219_07610 [Clostridia bacterium]
MDNGTPSKNQSENPSGGNNRPRDNKPPRDRQPDNRFGEQESGNSIKSYSKPYFRPNPNQNNAPHTQNNSGKPFQKRGDNNGGKSDKRIPPNLADGERPPLPDDPPPPKRFDKPKFDNKNNGTRPNGQSNAKYSSGAYQGNRNNFRNNNTRKPFVNGNVKPFAEPGTNAVSSVAAESSDKSGAFNPNLNSVPARQVKGNFPRSNHKSGTLKDSGAINGKVTAEPEDPNDFTLSPMFPGEKAKIEEPEYKGAMVEIIGVRFKPIGKIYFFSPGKFKINTGDYVVVETSRGIEIGIAAIGNKSVRETKVPAPVKPVLRLASPDDISRYENNKALAKEALKTAGERIKYYGLKMKPLEAEYTFDNSKLIIYFYSERRVDFRELVKDLASIYRIRIELRQIGLRDQTKVMGGLSVCGRPFCCSSFLQDFDQVTIKMAKDQGLSINSAKISGACGRLMCCLKYEHEAYEILGRDTPKPGSIVEVINSKDHESGIVSETSILTGIVKVKLFQKSGGNSGETKSYRKGDLKVTGYVKNSVADDEKESPEAADPVVESSEIPETITKE